MERTVVPVCRLFASLGSGYRVQDREWAMRSRACAQGFVFLARRVCGSNGRNNGTMEERTVDLMPGEGATVQKLAQKRQRNRDSIEESRNEK
jgi:hypothetical protein